MKTMLLSILLAPLRALNARNDARIRRMQDHYSARYRTMPIDEAVSRLAAHKGMPGNVDELIVLPSGDIYRRPVTAGYFMGGTVHDDVDLTEDDAPRF